MTEKSFSPFTFHPSLKHNCAFTLAEVLITLGIIGVVAAITLPGVVQNYKEQVTVKKLSKVYSILEQAFIQAVNDNGTIDNWCTADELWNACSLNIYNTIKPYLKNVKSGKVPGGYGNRFTNAKTNALGSFTTFSLPDGMIVGFQATSGGNSKTSWCRSSKNLEAPYSFCGYVRVDVNGLKGPNVIDLDLFGFVLYKDGIIPAGNPAHRVWTMTFDNQCLGKSYYGGYGCTAWIINNQNMDYLHCPDKLGWNKASSCKE